MESSSSIGMSSRTRRPNSNPRAVGRCLETRFRYPGEQQYLKKQGDHTMSTYSALTVPTRFVEADGVRFAYRRWGKPGGLPLVFLNYFSGNLDDWDPQVTDGFAADHDVIL